jgi:hydroxymethylpyrimidine pyrophosphatase-like HAD family hydrolase
VVRLVFCDIDHTLLSEAGELLEVNAEAIRRAVAEGVTVVLATARSYIGALPIYKALALKTPMIVSNGTLICQEDGEVMRAEVLEPPRAQELVEMFTQTSLHWAFRTVERAYLHPEFPLLAPHLRDARHYRRIGTEELTDALGDYGALVSASLFSNGHPVRPIYEGYDWRAKGLRPSFYPPSHFDPREAMTLIAAWASKGRAAAYLRRHLGLEDAPVLAIGDSPDDVSMFELGTGVAPANASPQARAAADWIAPPSDEGSVAAALERFVFSAQAERYEYGYTNAKTTKGMKEKARGRLTRMAD